MSTVASSNTDLSLNADGSGNGINFKSNGSQVGNIDASGNLTVSGNISAKTVLTGGSPGAVEMYRTSASDNNADPDTFTVYLPDGSTLSTTGTTTGGLQEAINYANNNGYDFFLHGGGIEATGTATDIGVINLSSSLTIPACQNRSFEFRSVTLNFTSALGSNAGLIFNSFMMMDFDFRGQIVYAGTGNAVDFNSSNAVPLDNVVTQIDSSIRIDTIAYIGSGASSGASCIKFTSPLSRCRLQFTEINGSGYDLSTSTATTYADYGLLIHNANFEHNLVDIGGIHHVKNAGMQVGVSTSITPNGNSFRIGVIQPDGNTSTTVGINTFGKNNYYDFAVTNGAGSFSHGINGNTASAYEYVVMRQCSNPSVGNINDSTVENNSLVVIGNTSTTL